MDFLIWYGTPTAAVNVTESSGGSPSSWLPLVGNSGQRHGEKRRAEGWIIIRIWPNGFGWAAGITRRSEMTTLKFQLNSEPLQKN
jgi:hypothetical protein